MAEVRHIVVGAVLAALLLVGCGASGGNDPVASSTTKATSTTEGTTTTTSTTSTTTSTTTTTTAPPTTAPPTTTLPPRPAYGSPCALGSDPDCIDPDGDGQGTYLQWGAACMAEMAPTLGPGICTDLDGDGRAGYPDSG